tara:strand:+ start:421 stop:1065 length:645 start_codon:yes stop_codon:yes gene_type:complete
MNKNKFIFLNKKSFISIYCFFLFFLFFKVSIANSVLEVSDDDFIIGEKNAPITIIEYASLSCIHCAKFHKDTLPLIMQEYINSGKAKIIFRDFPLNFPALMASVTLQCIDKEIRYEYLSALFALQEQWVNKDFEISKKELFKIMQTGGMTKDQFDKCINNKELEDKILQKLINAKNEFDIGTTPSFLINGELIEGNKPFKDFKEVIEKIINNSE